MRPAWTSHSRPIADGDERRFLTVQPVPPPSDRKRFHTLSRPDIKRLLGQFLGIRFSARKAHCKFEKCLVVLSLIYFLPL